MANRPYKNVKRFVDDINKNIGQVMKEKEEEKKENASEPKDKDLEQE